MATNKNIEIAKIDFKKLTEEQKKCLTSLIHEMQKTITGDLHHLKNLEIKILTSASDQEVKKGKEAVLDFDTLDEKTTEILSHVIQSLQESLIQEMKKEKGDPDKKGIFISDLNFSSNELIEEIVQLTDIGIHFLQLHWEVINTPFTAKAKRKYLICTFPQALMIFIRKIFSCS